MKMKEFGRLCDLCKKEAVLKTSLLCASCTDGVSRVMTVARWEYERGIDKERNDKQAKLLICYLEWMHRRKALVAKA